MHYSKQGQGPFQITQAALTPRYLWLHLGVRVWGGGGQRRRASNKSCRRELVEGTHPMLGLPEDAGGPTRPTVRRSRSAPSLLITPCLPGSSLSLPPSLFHALSLSLSLPPSPSLSLSPSHPPPLSVDI